MKMLSCLILCLCLFIMTGCVSREQADAKLTRACEAGIKATLPEHQTFEEILDSQARDSSIGSNMRQIKIKGKLEDGWLGIEENFTCIFEESFGLLGNSHTAAIYQLRLPGKAIGQAGSDITGSAQEFIRLTDAVSEALYNN